MLFWLALFVIIPFIVIVISVVMIGDDFWQLITFRMDFGRLFSDFFHIVALVFLGIVAWGADIFEIVRHLA
ncbi:hypothetical protein [Acidithiobacillus ferriphilus]|uniref:hypothetical protein n=1 Tax=Acidithiobacillus ferriphilus TaxID=1689834 RepID=UPI002DB86A49|nr:hypothetical protein [Acidithiobacillus ferriphilus]MEB8476712.1 hypothetical protein [Acidithiobacillus ferriphilus]